MSRRGRVLRRSAGRVLRVPPRPRVCAVCAGKEALYRPWSVTTLHVHVGHDTCMCMSCYVYLLCHKYSTCSSRTTRHQMRLTARLSERSLSCCEQLHECEPRWRVVLLARAATVRREAAGTEDSGDRLRGPPHEVEGDRGGAGDGRSAERACRSYVIVCSI